MATPTEESVLSSGANEAYVSDNGTFAERGDMKLTKITGGPSRLSLDAILILLFCLFSVVINVRVMWVVITVAKRRLRSMSILVAHLSSVAISFSLVATAFIVEKWDLATLIQPGTCQLFSFFRDTIYFVYPLSVASIIQQMVRTVPAQLGKSLVMKILGIWILTGISNIPAIFMVEYEEDSWKCQPIPLWGGLGFGPTLAYELFRFILFHVLVAGYVIYAMFQIRSKMRYLHIPKLLPSEVVRRKVKRIWYVYAHSIIFIGLWIPTGVILTLFNIFIRIGFGRINLVKLFSRVVIPSGLLFFMLSPLIYLCFIENIPVSVFVLGKMTSGLFGLVGRRVSGRREEVDGSGKRIAVVGRRQQLLDMSRMFTMTTWVPFTRSDRVSSQCGPLASKAVLNTQLCRKAEGTKKGDVKETTA